MLRREAPRRVRAPEAKFTRACSRETSAAAFPRRALATLAGRRMLVLMCYRSHACSMSNSCNALVGLLHGHTVAGTRGRRVGVEVFAIRVPAGLCGRLRWHCPRSHKAFQKRREHCLAAFCPCSGTGLGRTTTVLMYGTVKSWAVKLVSDIEISRNKLCPVTDCCKGSKTRATCVLCPEFDCQQQATWPKCDLLFQRNVVFWIWKRKLCVLATVSTISRGPMNEIERLLRPQQV